MSKFYELIRKDIEELNKYRELEKTDFKKAKSFPKVYEAETHRYRINSLLEIISQTIRKTKGEQAFKDIMDKYQNVRKDILINYVKYSYEYKMNPILDYETLFNHIEESITDNISDEIIKGFEKN